MNDILSLLDNYTLDNADDIAKALAEDFRKRRVEKNMTRQQLAEKSGVAVSNIVRFEQKGLISLNNLIGIAMIMGYTSEVKKLFAEPKYSTMEELMQIRENRGKTRAHKKKLTVASNEPNDVTKVAIEEARSGKLRNVAPVDTSSVEAMFKPVE